MKKRCLVILVIGLIFAFFADPCFSAKASVLNSLAVDARITGASRLEPWPQAEKGPDFPLRAVISEKSLFHINSKGKTDTQIPLEQCVATAIAADGAVWACIDKDNVIKLQTLGADTALNSSFPVPKAKVFAPPPDIVIGPKQAGYGLVLISPFTNTIVFLDREGKLLAEHTVEDAGGAVLKFSEKGDRVLIHFPNLGTGTSHGYLLCFSPQGKLLWRHEHSGCEAAFDLSANSERFAIAAKDRLVILDQHGKNIKEYPVIPGRAILSLSGNGRYAALAALNSNRIDMYDNDKGVKAWSKTLKNEAGIISTLSFSRQGQVLALGFTNERSYVQSMDSLLLLLDDSGKTLQRMFVPVSWIFRNLVSEDGCLLVLGDNKVILYRVDFSARAFPK